MTDKILTWRDWFTHPLYILACGFGSGLLPVVPGTWGSLMGLLLYFPLVAVCSSQLVYIVWVGLACVIGVKVCAVATRALQQPDHPSIVWDEICGMWLTLWLGGSQWYWPLLAFFWFRVFDMLKPWPISWLDRHIKGGWGIMLDDLAAAVPAWILTQLIGHWLAR